MSSRLVRDLARLPCPLCPDSDGLELALRLLQARDPKHISQAVQDPEQQEGQAAADTRDEGLHERETGQTQEAPQRGELSENEARRLWASFGLMERENSR